MNVATMLALSTIYGANIGGVKRHVYDEPSAAKFPALSGQHAKYTAKALTDFASGARSNDEGKMMRDVAGKLKADEIKAVSAYIAGLH